MNIITFLQSFQTDLLTNFFKFFTFFGDKEFYIMVLPLFFWLWGKDKALKLLFILLPSLLLNFYLKEIFQTARPIGVALIEQGGFAFPSGHAQGSVTLWLMLALLVREKWMNIFAIIMIIFVPLSRLYLGVHYPVDILGGLFIGLTLVLIYDKYLFDALKEYLSAKTAIGQAILLTIVVLFLLVIYPLEDAITLLSVIWGFGMVLIFSDVMNSKLKSGIHIKLFMLILGVIGILLIWKGLKIVLPPSGISRFLRYSLIGIWTAFMPILFKHK